MNDEQRQIVKEIDQFLLKLRPGGIRKIFRRSSARSPPPGRKKYRKIPPEKLEQLQKRKHLMILEGLETFLSWTTKFLGPLFLIIFFYYLVQWDLFQKSFIIILRLITDEHYRNIFLHTPDAVTLFVFIIEFAILIFILKIIYNLLFPKLFVERKNGVLALQGRIFWVTGTWFQGLKKKAYAWAGKEYTPERVAYVKPKRKRLLNLLFPMRSLKTYRFIDGEVERHIFQTNLRQDSGLLISWDPGEREYVVRKDDSLTEVPANAEELKRHVEDRIIKIVIPHTQKASFADAYIRKDQLRSAYISFPHEIIENVEQPLPGTDKATIQVIKELSDAFHNIYNTMLKNRNSQKEIAQAVSPLVLQIVPLVEKLRKKGYNEFPDITKYLGPEWQISEMVHITRVQRYMNAVREIATKISESRWST